MLCSEDNGFSPTWQSKDTSAYLVTVVNPVMGMSAHMCDNVGTLLAVIVSVSFYEGHICSYKRTEMNHSTFNRDIFIHFLSIIRA